MPALRHLYVLSDQFGDFIQIFLVFQVSDEFCWDDSISKLAPGIFPKAGLLLFSNRKNPFYRTNNPSFSLSGSDLNP
jgi:hypothetical protein